MENIMISILIPTYGHEKYIAEALESVLKQKTQYRYEVIVGEDASPDNTRIILQEYEKRYPDIFTMIYRDINCGCTLNVRDCMHRASGKYIAVLEGDDFWITEDKLEKQVSFLERHPEYTAVASNCLVVNQHSIPNGEEYPECKDIEYTLSHYRKDILPGQTASMLYRAEAYKQITADEIWRRNPMPGDRILFLGVAAKGRIRCMQEKMSAYRHVVSGGSSYSANIKRDFNEEIVWSRMLLEFARRQGNQNVEIAAEVRYLAIIVVEGLMKNDITLWQACCLYQHVEHKFKVFIIKVVDFMARKFKEQIQFMQNSQRCF